MQHLSFLLPLSLLPQLLSCTCQLFHRTYLNHAFFISPFLVISSCTPTFHHQVSSFSPADTCLVIRKPDLWRNGTWLTATCFTVLFIFRLVHNILKSNIRDDFWYLMVGCVELQILNIKLSFPTAYITVVIRNLLGGDIYWVVRTPFSVILKNICTQTTYL